MNNLGKGLATCGICLLAGASLFAPISEDLKSNILIGAAVFGVFVWW